MLAVIVVHNTFAAEGLGFLSLLASADGLKFDTSAVMCASFLPCRLGFQLLQVWLVRTAGYRHDQGYCKLINRQHYFRPIYAV